MHELRQFISEMNLTRGAEEVIFGEVSYPPGGECGPRHQPDFQLVLLFSGSVKVTVDDTVHTLLPGQGILLAPGHREHFAFDPDKPSRHGWCAIKPRKISKDLTKAFLDCPHPGILRRPGNTLFETAFVSGHERPGNETSEAAFLLQLGLALLSRFAADQHGAVPAPDAAMEKVEKALAFIRDEYARPLKLTDIAQFVGASPQHLLKCFRQSKQPTPTQYLYQIRLLRSRELLQDTGLTIAEIAYSCGFESPYHFSRRFRQEFGQPPRQYRLHLWGVSP